MQTDNLTRWLSGVTNILLQGIVRHVIQPVYDRHTSFALTSAGLTIKAGGSAVVKSGSSDQYLLADGVLQKIAASTDMPALSGTVTADKFNVYCFFIDSAGTKTSAMGTEGATLAAVEFPQFPVKKALIGFVIINPTGTGDFTGGTTALDDGTVTPNAVYVNPVSGFDPYCLIGAGKV